MTTTLVSGDSETRKWATGRTKEDARYLAHALWKELDRDTNDLDPKTVAELRRILRSRNTEKSMKAFLNKYFAERMLDAGAEDEDLFVRTVRGTLKKLRDE